MRGDVHLVDDLELPNDDDFWEDDEHDKFVIALRDRQSNEKYVPVVLACTNKRESQRVYAYEVDLDPSTEWFPRATLIDCRWVFTLHWTRLTDGNKVFSLDTDTMARVSAGLLIGLQIKHFSAGLT